MSEHPVSSSFDTLFDDCPDPLAIVEGDTIVAANQAFRTQLGDDAKSLRGCIDAVDHDKIPQTLGTSQKFVTRIGCGALAGNLVLWTMWSAGAGRSCLRIDTNVPPAFLVPAPLAPLFDTPPTVAELLAGKVFGKLDSTIWSVAPDGTLLISDGPGLVHFGIKPGQIVGLNAFQIYPPDSSAVVDMKASLAGSSVRREQMEAGGHWLMAADPVRNANGDVTAMLAFGWCVTDMTKDLRQVKALLSAVAELPVTVWAMEADGTCTLSVGKGLEHLGMKSGQLVGKNLLQVYAADPVTLGDLKRALQGESITREVQIGDMTWFSMLLPVRGALGTEVTQVYGVAENMTERAQAQRELSAQLELIQSQQQAIAALTSPIIEVWKGVLVVPLIGSLDAGRAAQLVERLLSDVVVRQSHAVILDLTGADMVDPSTAQHVFDIMRSVRLLGAEGLVSGIRPSVAKTMVELDIADTSWKTFPTLAEALRRLLGKRLTSKA